MPAPTNYPDWGTDEVNNLEPPGAKKAQGWVPAEQPPSGWFNWWQWVVGLWVRWLDTRTTEHEAEITTLQADVDALEDAHTTLAGDAARTSVANTFTKGQTINAEAGGADAPLLTTTQKPGDDPTDIGAPGTNKWKLVLGPFPTDRTSESAPFAAVGFYVGQGAKLFAITYNARWHIPTQKWRHLDADRAAYALVNRDGIVFVCKVEANAASWADWPAGGDLAAYNVVAAGAVSAGADFRISSLTGEYNFTTPRSRGDWTIPLACSSGETFLQSDGSYTVGTAGASWPLKVPHATRLTNIYLIVEHYSGASSSAWLVRRSKGNVILPTTWPTQETIASAPLNPATGVQVLTIGCDGHEVDSAYEYSVRWVRAHANDKIGRIVLGEFLEKGIRNYG